jgi:hypothetical protein
MKIIISESQYKLLIENNNIVDDESKYLLELENEISNLETEYSDIISKYRTLKDKIDEVKERKNVNYTLSVSKDKGYGKYVTLKVKYKDKWFTIHLMRFDDYEKLSDREKKQSIKDIIEKYLMKRFPLTR